METTGKNSFYIPPEELIPMVERLQRGETRIGDEIIEAFYQKVLGHTLKMEKDYAQAEEIVGNVFMEAAHSSMLSWEILWTEEPGGLQSKGSQKSQTGLSD